MSRRDGGVVWNVFDREAPTLVTHRHRPHWDQTGALTFVTFRLADSMPRHVVERWIYEQQQWLIANGFVTVHTPRRNRTLARGG